MNSESQVLDTTTGDWILDQCSKLAPEARERIAADFEGWQEREAIQQESRDAEAIAAKRREISGDVPAAAHVDRVEGWIADMYPNPAKMGLSWDDMSATQRAIFVGELNRPDARLDVAIQKTRAQQLAAVDTAKRVFRKVSA
jgi:hypothetical protein